MLSQEEVKHIAELARLKLTSNEIVKMQKDLADILDYMALLNQLEVSKTQAMFLPSQSQNITRQDKPIPSDPETVQNMLNQVPQKQGDFVKVKEILK